MIITVGDLLGFNHPDEGIGKRIKTAVNNLKLLDSLTDGERITPETKKKLIAELHKFPTWSYDNYPVELIKRTGDGNKIDPISGAISFIRGLHVRDVY